MARESAAKRPPTTEILIETAERLIAEHGVLGVSMRQIAVEAGQRNAGVIQYHFGSHEGLLDAIFRSRMPEMDARRHAVLRDIEAAGRANELRALVEAIVQPFAEISAESPYLGFLARLHEYHGGWENMPAVYEVFSSATTIIVDRIAAIVADVPKDLVRRRIYYCYGFAIQALALARRPGAPPRALTAAELVDMLTGAISAPAHPEDGGSPSEADA